MKTSPAAVLACFCLMTAAFLGGMYYGRNIINTPIQSSEFSTVVQVPTANAASNPTSATVTTEPGKVNINTADLKTLMTLEGIGEVYAQRIIDYREANGPFSDITELTNVEGIGQKRFEAIMDDITTGG